MSAPATNARPAPVRMTPAIASFTRISSIAWPSSAIVASFRALSLSGRLTVRVATPLSTSSVKNLKGMCSYLLVNLPASVERRRPLKSTQKLRPWGDRINGAEVDRPRRREDERIPLQGAQRKRNKGCGTTGAHRCAPDSAGVARCAHLDQCTRRDPGVGVRRPRTEAIQVSSARSREGRAPEILPRPADGARSPNSAREDPARFQPQGFDERQSMRRNRSAHLAGILSRRQREVPEGEQHLRHYYDAQVARCRPR